MVEKDSKATRTVYLSAEAQLWVAEGGLLKRVPCSRDARVGLLPSFVFRLPSSVFRPSIASDYIPRRIFRLAKFLAPKDNNLRSPSFVGIFESKPKLIMAPSPMDGTYTSCSQCNGDVPDSRLQKYWQAF